MDLQKELSSHAPVLEEALSNARKEFETTQARQRRAREARLGIGKVYHPFDLKTGAPKEASEAQAGLNSHFDTLDQIAAETHLKPSSFARLSKAKRVLPSMIETLVFFWTLIAARAAALSFSPEIVKVWQNQLVAGYYLASVAQLFQRSSSCVEGRNGKLSLRHHGLREISPRKLRVLGVLHNFVIKRSDGSTAANRFFGQKHRELFPWLLEHMQLPPRPRRKTKS